MNRGEVWWVDLPEPVKSEPGFRRPVVIVSSDAFNLSGINTVLIAAVTTNLNLAKMPGNILLPQRKSGLPKDSVVNVSQIATLDKSSLTDCIGTLPPDIMKQIDDGLRLVMDL